MGLVSRRRAIRERLLRACSIADKAPRGFTLLHFVGSNTRGLFEGFDSHVRLLLAIAVNQAQTVPQVVFECGVTLVGHAMNVLAIRALEVFPIALRSEDLVDRFKRFAFARGFISSVRSKCSIGFCSSFSFIAIQLRDRIVIARLDFPAVSRYLSCVREPRSSSTMARLLVDRDDLMHQYVVFGLQFESFFEGVDRLRDVCPRATCRRSLGAS